jgi:hypothetical protein
MTLITFLGSHTDNHTMESWRIPLFVIFVMCPGFFLKFLLVPIVGTRWGFVLQIALVNSFLWTALAAGIVFVSAFAEAGFKGEALGSNLLGAAAGGFLESLSYWTGLKALLIVAAILYSVSLVAAKSKVRDTAPVLTKS